MTHSSHERKEKHSFEYTMSPSYDEAASSSHPKEDNLETHWRHWPEVSQLAGSRTKASRTSGLKLPPLWTQFTHTL